MNTWDALRERLAEHRMLQSAVHSNVRTMADMVVGQLRNSDVGTDTLARLKRELADFNIHTGRWRAR